MKTNDNYAHFLTNVEAASAIAAALHPQDEQLRSQVDTVYRCVLYDALCSGELTGRYPDTRLRIDPERLGSILAFSDCLIGVQELNALLDQIGCGVQVASGIEEQPPAAAAEDQLPTSRDVAEAFGPYLSEGKDEHWLKRILGEKRGRPSLIKFRCFPEGCRTARWNPVGVAKFLIEHEHMTRDKAREAVRVHFLEKLHLLDGLCGTGRASPASTWHP
ncbi:hypothetical protein [Pandoraea terrigena]|uniref:Uncharacterized protein n=1 Tax=Pandoraea terrigena TaxID=2508292 RepID=A0A5E4UQ27_9BURK|nr:hypothetical protein [Pandoraea terrigena]VVE01644.1 hypothetical protein PTE31013_02174 [Pandoraea terrigena]